ncbi:cytochrome b561 domain-containing protein 2-like [Anoplophora glabripennis]|uniref:cytochrome b561 domain-containing protein 2-like n=1 Tax=Anoplophora glabripennis TaxID=217634 RepID=UPI000874D3DF|nr:cytochrome b561 domain-containing protein 2-like [Anoplophora glabripennis]
MTVAKVEITLTQRLLWILNLVFHQVVAIVTVWLFWLFFDNIELNNTMLWHLVLSTAAYVPLMAEAIILFAGDNLWSQGLERPKKNWVHGVLLGISIVSVTAGIACIISGKNDRGTAHFVSNHAITGLVSWLLAFVSIILGLFSWHAQGLKNIARPVAFKFIHNFIGIACYAIGIASLCLGFYIGSFRRFVTDDQLKSLVALVAIIAFWSCLAAFKSCYSQLKNMFS